LFGVLQGSAGCFKKATETPNAGHRLLDTFFQKIISQSQY
jgi:hypothetical protein